MLYVYVCKSTQATFAKHAVGKHYMWKVFREVVVFRGTAGLTHAAAFGAGGTVCYSYFIYFIFS